MRVIYPQSLKIESNKERDVGKFPSLIRVHNAPVWNDLNIHAANSHVGQFLNFIKISHDEEFPIFASALINALDESDAGPERAIEILRDAGSIMTFTDLLALLGPAVQYALSLAKEEGDTQSSETIEKFVISLVLSLAETTNKFSGKEKLLPLDEDLIEGITVTVRNIMYAYRKDFAKIDYENQIKTCFSFCKKK